MSFFSELIEGSVIPVDSISFNYLKLFQINMILLVFQFNLDELHRHVNWNEWARTEDYL